MKHLRGFRLDTAIRIEEPSDGRTDFPGSMGGVSVVPGVVLPPKIEGKPPKWMVCNGKPY